VTQWPSSASRCPVLLTCTLVFCVVLGACSPAPPAAPKGVLAVKPPENLAELDVTVRDQFNEYWKALEDARPDSEQAGIAWGHLGQWFYVYRYEASAESCFGNAGLLDPGEARWPYYQGLIAMHRGELEQANSRFKRSAELAPDMPAAQIELGNVAITQSKLDVADSHFHKVLSLNSNDVRALFGVGQVALARGNPEAARDAFEQLLVLQPEASQVHYSLALAWRQLGDRKRAAEHMAKVPDDNGDQISLSSDDPWSVELSALDQGAVALTRRAVRAAHRGNHGDAALLFGRAVIANPDGPDNRVNYAKALIAIHQPDGAIEQLVKALALSKDEPEPASRAHVALGSVYASQGRESPAEAEFRSALANDPASVEAHVQLGRVLQSQKRYEEALAEYASVREMAGAYTEVRFWHAALLVILNRRDEASKAIEDDISQLGDDSHLRLLLARILVTSADAKQRDLIRARQLLGDPVRPDVFYAESAAMVAAAEGRFADAVAWQHASLAPLVDDRTRLAAHIARRRLALYEQRLPCRNPWEVTERVVFKRIAAPASPP
jgi:tetratricopeptide (TPR) repeat protein